MKIAIDGRVLQYHREGIVCAMLGLLQALQGDFEFHLLLSDASVSIPELESLKNVKVHHFGPKAKKLAFIWEEYFLPNKIREIGPDIYHAPFNLGIPRTRIRRVRYVATIHDLIPLHYPESIPFFERMRWKMSIRQSLFKTDAIITDSNFTRNDIAASFHVDPSRCVVVPLFLREGLNRSKVTVSALATFRDKNGIRGRYILYYGGFRAYKQVKKVAAVFDAYKKKYGDDLKLVIAGTIPKSFESGLRPCLQSSSFARDIILTGFISEEELPLLVGGAEALVYLSLMEGFGYVPLEAMACGTPVVCAKNSSMSEYLDDRAVSWVDEDAPPNFIADRVRELVQNVVKREEMIEAGYSCAIKFTKKNYSDQMRHIYNELIRKPIDASA